MTVALGYMDPGKWSAVFGMSLCDLYLYDRIVGGNSHIDTEYRVQAGAGGLADGRNHIAEQFMDSDSEWLFMIDSDMGFASDTVERLLSSAHPEHRPVLGGLCFQLYDKDQRASFNGKRYGIMPTLYESMGEGYRHIPDYKRDSVMRVDATGGACLLIHRGALSAIADNWFTELPGYSEDLSFMQRCDAQGIPVHVDTSVKTTHDKGALFLDEELYDQSRPWARDFLEE